MFFLCFQYLIKKNKHFITFSLELYKAEHVKTALNDGPDWSPLQCGLAPSSHLRFLDCQTSGVAWPRMSQSVLFSICASWCVLWMCLGLVVLKRAKTQQSCDSGSQHIDSDRTNQLYCCDRAETDWTQIWWSLDIPDSQIHLAVYNNINAKKGKNINYSTWLTAPDRTMTHFCMIFGSALFFTESVQVGNVSLHFYLLSFIYSGFIVLNDVLGLI